MGLRHEVRAITGKKRREYSEVREGGNHEYRAPDALEGRGSGAVRTRSAPKI